MENLENSIDPEDILKVHIYNEVNRRNPGLAKNHPEQYARLCFTSYEKCRNILEGERVPIKKESPPRTKRSFTLNEYLQNSLVSYAEGYCTLNTKKRRERDRKAWKFLKKWCKEFNDSQYIRSLWKFYSNIKKSSKLNEKSNS